MYIVYKQAHRPFAKLPLSWYMTHVWAHCLDGDLNTRNSNKVTYRIFARHNKCTRIVKTTVHKRVRILKIAIVLCVIKYHQKICQFVFSCRTRYLHLLKFILCQFREVFKKYFVSHVLLKIQLCFVLFNINIRSHTIPNLQRIIITTTHLKLTLPAI